ncbi:MAG TPA: META domain-containing protein [Coriobacteriia bacterium]|nr:META domain-containing protein [Coriobacteriia bacterium]
MPKLTRAILIVMLMAFVGLLAGCGGGQASLEGTKWKLTGWSISAAAGDEFATTLEFNDGKLGGKAPVNSYGASYEARSNGTLTMGDVGRTLMAGPEPQMQAEDRYFALLSQVKRYEVKGDELTLSDANGNPQLIFARQK